MTVARWWVRQAVKFAVRMVMLAVLFSAAGGMDFGVTYHRVPSGRAPWLTHAATR